MLLNQSTAALRVIPMRLYDASGVALSAAHVFAAGDVKLIQPDGTIANATNLPTPVTNTVIAGSFNFQLEQSEIQQLGELRIQVHGASYSDFEWVETIEGYEVVSGSAALPPGNNKTLQALMDSVRYEGAYENSSDITDTVLADYINKALIRGRELIVKAWRDYFTVPATSFTVTSGTDTYALPTDFAQLRKVEIQCASDPTKWRKLYPMNLEDSTRHQRSTSRHYRYWLSGQTNQLTLAPVPSNSTDVIRVWYIPRAPFLVSTSDFITIQVDAEFELYVSLALRKCKLREDLDVSEIDRTIADCVARLSDMAEMRDASEPFYLGDHASDDDDYDEVYR